MEALILVGGFGTRLKSVVSDVPKPMAPVSGRPFLEYLVQKLVKSGIDKIVLSTGYMHETIESYFGDRYEDAEISYSRELTPLGTGGGIKQALMTSSGKHVLVLNGDTFFDINYRIMIERHIQTQADLTMGLKPMSHCVRYGTISIEGNRVIRFNEKGWEENGLINSGVYVCRSDVFDGLELSTAFSLEKDFLEPYASVRNFRAVISDEYFIDIGVPADYFKAQSDLGKFT